MVRDEMLSAFDALREIDALGELVRSELSGPHTQNRLKNLSHFFRLIEYVFHSIGIK
jgi:hypothetical protein